MTVDAFGNYTFALAVLMAGGGMLAAVAAGRLGSRSLLAWARAAVLFFTALMVVGSFALLAAIVDNNFALEYVAKNSARDMPLGYKCAAFWAGQEGSLLLWTLMLAGMTCIVAFTGLRASPAAQGAPLAILLGVCGFFALLMLLVPEANPFKLAGLVPDDGRGMNPLLQDPAMIIHPPALFLGYAACTVPFALVLGAVIVGRSDKDWLLATRRWAVAAWAFLTAGILLGSYWAYYELGWGGYWAWDPVENASLVPWFTATCLIHSLLMFQRRGTFKVWSLCLAATSFLLCLLAAFITRSGLITSVHAFGKSPVGWFLLAMMGLCLALWVGVLIARWRYLRAEHPLERLVGLDGGIHAANILCVAMALTVAVGTLWPLFPKLLEWAFNIKIVINPHATADTSMPGAEFNLNADFYNTVVIPMGLALVTLMAIGPVLSTLKGGWRELGRRIAIPFLLALLVAEGVRMGLAPAGHPGWKALYRNPALWWTAGCVAISTLAVAIIAWDFVVTLARHLRDARTGPLSCIGRALAVHSTRLGAHIVHLGMIMLVMGVVGSSLHVTKADLELKAGETAKVGRYTVEGGSLAEVKGPNFQAIETRVVLTDPSGDHRQLAPQRRRYGSEEKGNLQNTKEVAIRSSLRDDVYMILESWGQDGQTVYLQANIFPLINWMWIGGFVMTAGCILCMVRAKGPRTSEPEAPRDVMDITVE